METYPRGTVTFLFTDLEGSTRFWQAYPDQRKHRVCATLLERHSAAAYSI